MFLNNFIILLNYYCRIFEKLMSSLSSISDSTGLDIIPELKVISYSINNLVSYYIIIF